MAVSGRETHPSNIGKVNKVSYKKHNYLLSTLK